MIRYSSFRVISLILSAVIPLCAAARPLSAQNLTAQSAGLGRWTVRLAALTPHGRIETITSVGIQSWTTKGHIMLRSRDKMIHLTTAELLSLRHNAHATIKTGPTPTHWWLLLRTGDLLPGTPDGSTSGKLTFDSLVFGKLVVPLDDVAGLSRSRKTPLLSGKSHDHLQFLNGDQLTGTMLRILPHAVEWQSTLGRITIPLARVNVMKLAQTVPPPIYRGPLIHITCADGTVVTGESLAFRGQTVTLTAVVLTPMICGINIIKRIDITGGNLSWLTNLVPQQYIQTPYVGPPWRLRKNRNCIGQALRANGRIFKHGLGTHVVTRLTYNLADAYSLVTFIPAMDQSSRPWGAGKVTVRADGKPIFTSNMLRVGDALTPVVLPVKHVERLTFIMTGDNAFGVRGRVDLLDAALLK